MSLLMVPDPTHKGRGVPNEIPRSWAMRKLYEGGMSIGDIARQYGTTYQMAYKSINPKRVPASSPRSTARKELTSERLANMSKQDLIKAQDVRQKALDADPSLADRVEAYQAELSRRWPTWLEELAPRR